MKRKQPSAAKLAALANARAARQAKRMAANNGNGTSPLPLEHGRTQVTPGDFIAAEVDARTSTGMYAELDKSSGNLTLVVGDARLPLRIR
jgi:hypothetical protein